MLLERFWTPGRSVIFSEQFSPKIRVPRIIAFSSYRAITGRVHAAKGVVLRIVLAILLASLTMTEYNLLIQMTPLIMSRNFANIPFILLQVNLRWWTWQMRRPATRSPVYLYGVNEYHNPLPLFSKLVVIYTTTNRLISQADNYDK